MFHLELQHQNLIKEKIKSTKALENRREVNPSKKKLSDWRKDAMDQTKIIDLTKTLYIGPLRLSREYRSLICMAQMSRYNYNN